MSGIYTYDESRYPFLWNGCLRAFNPAIGANSRTFGTGITNQGNYVDFSKYAKHGTFNNSLAYDAAYNIHVVPVGGFAGVKNSPNAASHIKFPDTGLPTGNQNLSMSIWVYAYGYSSGAVNSFLCYGDARSGGSSEAPSEAPSEALSGFSYESTGGGGVYGKSARIAMYDGQIFAGVYAYDTYGATITLNKWTHIAMTLDSNRVCRLYVNGKFNAVSTLTSVDITLWGDGYIGAYNDIGMKYNANASFGTAGIWNRLLSDEEIYLLGQDQYVMYQKDPIKKLSIEITNYSYIATGGLILGGDSIELMPSFPMRLTTLDSELYSTEDFVIVKPMLLTTLDSELYSTIPYPVYNFFNTASGSLILGDTSLVEYGLKHVSSGGLILGDTSLVEYGLKHVSSGGLILSGIFVSDYQSVLITNFNHTASGNLILGGTSLAQNSFKYKYDLSGTLMLSHISSFEIEYDLVKIIYLEQNLNYIFQVEAFKDKVLLKASMKIY